MFFNLPIPIIEMVFEGKALVGHAARAPRNDRLDVDLVRARLGDVDLSNKTRRREGGAIKAFEP